MFLSSRTILRVLTLCGVLFAVAGAESKGAPEALRDSMAVQNARNEMTRTKGKKAFYTKRWNLDDLPAYAPKERIKGTIRFWGSNYMVDGNLAAFWEEGFLKFHPEAKLDMHFKAVSSAVPSLYTGVADIGIGAIKTESLLAFERLRGYSPTRIVIAGGSYNVAGWNPAYSIFVHKNNPISKLTMAQLDGIFGSARTGGWIGTEWHPEFARGADKNIRTWGQLGATGEWKDKRINVYGLPLRYGQATQVSNLLLKGSDKWNEDLRVYANYARPDGSLAIGSNLLTEDLSNDWYGIAYTGMQNLTPQTKAVAIAPVAGQPYIVPTLDTVRDWSYPLTEPVTAFIDRKPGAALDPKIREFLRYVLSREGQAVVMRDAKYLPLPGRIVKEELRKLD